MKTRTLQMISATLFLAIVSPALASAATPSDGSGNMLSPHGRNGIAAQIQPWEQFRIRLIGLQCQDEQDAVPFGSDEPYVLIGIIRGSANGNPPTFTFWHTDVYNGVDEGEVVLPDLDVLAGNIQSDVVLVSQVVESDGDTAQVVGNAMAHANDAFADALAAGNDNPMALGGAVGSAFYNAALASIDDPIGGPVRILIIRDRFDNLALGDSQTMVAQAQGNGGKYMAAYQLLRTR